MTQDATHDGLLRWEEYVDLLKRAGELNALTPDPASDQTRAEFYKQVAMNLTLGYFMHFQSTPEHPDWTPFLNSVFLLQPNPDDTYYYAPVRGDGVYRIVGERGSTRLMTFTLTRDKMGMKEKMGPAFGYYDADELTLDADGRFEVIFSTERPADWAGDWRYLHPETDNIVIRQRSYDWGRERDARFAIECLSVEALKPRLTVPYVDEKLRRMFGDFPYNLSKLWLSYQQATMARTELVNHARLTEFPSGLEVQTYWEGVYDIAEDEALILETELPEERRYWNIQLNDELWNATEYMHRQSSLNGHQARVDSDGRFRAVISLADPGVPNWLDTAGYRRGTFIGRWFQCSSHPVPTLKKVRLSEVREHLPADTPVVGAEARRAALRERRIGAQLRRRW
jgi:hypothetical protein